MIILPFTCAKQEYAGIFLFGEWRIQFLGQALYCVRECKIYTTIVGAL